MCEEGGVCIPGGFLFVSIGRHTLAGYIWDIGLYSVFSDLVVHSVAF